MDIVCIGLGSNLGDRLTNLRDAVRRLLLEHTCVPDGEDCVAGMYETSPIDMAAMSPPFLNSVIRIRCTLSSRELLERLLTIEYAMGRDRGAGNESRVIDLDVLLFGNLAIAEPGLTVPHPRLHERRFVLEPLSEVAGEWAHPTLGVDVTALARAARADRTDQAVTRLYGANWCDVVACGTDRPT